MSFRTLAKKSLFVAFASGATLGSGCSKPSAPPARTVAESTPAPAAAAPTAAPAAEAPVTVGPDVLQFFKALPARYDSSRNPITDAKVTLGRTLYFDPRLSKSQEISCNSCHDLAKFGVDGQPTSPGHKGQRGDRNSPTVYNAGDHLAQFWDGRAEDLEAQAKGPILNPVEMAMANDKAVVATLKTIPGYQDLFAKAFPNDKNPISYDNLAKAIGAFERQLVTPSRFDKFLGGEETALTNQEKRGLVTFARLGCTTCHNGSSVGGTAFQKLGLVKPFETKDEGRFKVTKDDSDKQKFRVPSLRNIAKTAPYMHDGAKTDLAEMVRLMADIQLGKSVSEGEVADVVSFLDALTGELPASLIEKPALPPNGPKTPKPQL